MESQLVTGIAHDKNEARVVLTRVPDRPGAVAAIFNPLAEAAINVDMIIQNVGRDKGETDVTFTVPQADLARAQALLEDRREAIGFNRIITDSKVAKISSSASACAATPASPRRCSRRSPSAGSTSRRSRPGNQDQRADRRGRDRTRGARAAHRLRPRRRGPGRVSARFARIARRAPAVGPAGATMTAQPLRRSQAGVRSRRRDRHPRRWRSRCCPARAALLRRPQRRPARAWSRCSSTSRRRHPRRPTRPTKALPRRRAAARTKRLRPRAAAPLAPPDTGRSRRSIPGSQQASGSGAAPVRAPGRAAGSGRLRRRRRTRRGRSRRRCVSPER